MILTIDPGVRGCGVAAWADSGELLRAAYVPSQSRDESDRIEDLACGAAAGVWAWLGELRREAPLTVLIERPQTYRGRAAKGDANDLLDLSVVVGSLVCSFTGSSSAHLVRPAEWKGQVPKKNQHGENVVEARARRRLGDLVARVDLSCGKTLAHNVWDAVGIGLWHLKGCSTGITA